MQRYDLTTYIAVRRKPCNMKFSIIVPIYNVEQYLAECLESVLNQTFQDFEIICINDASTDKSYEILLQYAKMFCKIKVFNNSCNIGPSASRNKGIDEAKGDYILFLDSDDMLRLDALSILNDAIEKHHVDMVCYRFLVKNEGKKSKEQNTLVNENVIFDGNIKTGQQWFVEMAERKIFFVSASFSLFKKEFLLDNSLRFLNGILYEDVLFTIQFSLVASRMIYIHEFIYIHRRRDFSITTTLSEYHLDSYIIVLGKILALWNVCKLEDGMNNALKQFVDKISSSIYKLIALFPEHIRMKTGTLADQFLFDLLKGSVREQFYYVDLSDQEFDQIRKYEKVIVFGAGVVATELITCLDNHHINVDAVAVSDKSMNKSEIAGIRIYQIEELIGMREIALVIVGILRHNQAPVFKRLEELGFRNILCIDTDKREH